MEASARLTRQDREGATAAACLSRLDKGTDHSVMVRARAAYFLPHEAFVSATLALAASMERLGG